MKIIVTGSLGHISQPLTKILAESGHSVTVISSDSKKQNSIEELGATAAIGSLEDPDFLTRTFTGADAVYTMVPPANYFDHHLDLTAYVHRIARNYADAIDGTGVKRVIHLSSIGAHMEKDSGIILAHHDVETILGKLQNAAITFMRPTSFYYNLYGYVNMIKEAGLIAANYGEDDLIPWVSPLDIAEAIAEEFEAAPVDRKIRYVASEELTASQSAAIIGEAIGKPDLQWKLISDEEAQQGLVAIGMNPRIAAGLVEMYAGLHNGRLSEDYFRNRPAVLGKVKLKDFVIEFAGAFK